MENFLPCVREKNLKHPVSAYIKLVYVHIIVNHYFIIIMVIFIITCILRIKFIYLNIGFLKSLLIFIKM